MFESWLAHPSTKHLSIDDPRTTLNRRRIIQEKKFLRLIYEDWYASIIAALPAGEGKLLELGSGAGFFREFIPDLITSEIFHLPGVDAVMDAQQLPLSDGVLRGIVMINVMHHLPEPRLFFWRGLPLPSARRGDHHDRALGDGLVNPGLPVPAS